ncbi:titin homolog [Hylaeus volcanicus]|uniref:titin homolog n=1 Tax=Hylaeus volcanicus TaxID=313075 RepID=UPI0023B7F983|nr:titin homolog [Hylaeus volcanicus]
MPREPEIKPVRLKEVASQPNGKLHSKKPSDDIEDIWADKPKERELECIKKVKESLKPISKSIIDKSRNEIEDIWANRSKDREVESIQKVKDALKPVVKSNKPRDEEDNAKLTLRSGSRKSSADVEHTLAAKPRDDKISPTRKPEAQNETAHAPKPTLTNQHSTSANEVDDEIEDIWADRPQDYEIRSIRISKDEEIPKLKREPLEQKIDNDVEDIWSDRPRDREIKSIWKEVPEKNAVELSQTLRKEPEDTWKPNMNNSSDKTDSPKSKTESPLVNSTNKVEEVVKPKLKTTRRKSDTDKKEASKPKLTSRKIDDVGKKKEPTTRRRSSTKSTEGSKVQGIENTILSNVSRAFYTTSVRFCFIFYMLYMLLIRANIIQDHEPTLASNQDTVSNDTKVYTIFLSRQRVHMTRKYRIRAVQTYVC